MKKQYDSSIDTLQHIITVGTYIDRVIEVIRNYKKLELTDNINNMNLIDYLYILQKGENLFDKNKLLNSIYKNSLDYKLKVRYKSKEELSKLYIEELYDRKVNHDRSKLEYPEKQAFDNNPYKLKEISYGSAQYFESLYFMRKALEHHYRYNRHHPEHFGNRMYGMNIMDLIEMICDWKASSERQDNSNIFDSIEDVQKKRFNYDSKMTRILENTVEKYLINGVQCEDISRTRTK